MSGITPVSSSSSGYYDPNEMQCVQETTPAPQPAPQARPVTANFSNPVVRSQSVPEAFVQGFAEGAVSWMPVACGLIGGAMAPDFDWDGGDTDTGTDVDTDSDTDVDTDSDTDTDTDSDTDTDASVCDNPPGAFTLSSPTNGAAAAPLTPNLQWEESVDPDLGDSVSYCVTLDNDASFASPIIDECDIPTTSYAVTTPLSYDTQYYWRVTAGDICEPSNITPANANFNFHTVDEGVCESGPEAFDLTTPADDASAVSLTPTLDWANSADPDTGDSVTYRVQVDNNSDFSSPVVNQSGLTVSQYTVPTPLAYETLYYWRAIASDTCATPNTTPSTSTYSFTTTDAGTCTTYPSAFDMEAPTNGASSAPTTPLLNWSDSTDPDSGDVVTYCVEVDNNASFASPEVDQCGITTSQYAVPGSTLNFSTTYYWRVRAVDNCSQETPSTTASFNFTTEDSCIPFSFSDTDFTSGTLGGGAVASSGSLMLSEDSSAWTYKYEGDVLPTADGWTQTGSFVSESASGGALAVNTIGSNIAGYYEINPSFNNSTGSVVDMNFLLNSQDDATPPSNAGFSLRMADGNRLLEFKYFNDRVCETLNTGTCYTVDTSAYHNYKVQFQGDNYMFYVDNAIAIDGTGMSGSGTGSNYLRFGDQATNPDSYYHLDYLYYYNGGASLPYITPGAYTGTPVNTGVAGYGYSGANMSWAPSTASGQASVQVRAADAVLDLSSQPWSSELTANPAPLPAISGQYLEWKVNLYAVPLTDTPVIDQIDGERTCP